MRSSDWSSDVCSSYLSPGAAPGHLLQQRVGPCGLARRRVYRGAQHPHPAFDRSDGRHSSTTGLLRDFDVTPRSAVGASPILHCELGRASCSERVCTYVSISVFAVSLTNTHSITDNSIHHYYQIDFIP